jgi:PilZ domain
MLQLDEGIAITCRVLDVSISGASVGTEARPEIGAEVVLGKLRAVVVRHHRDGIGVRFKDIQNPAALRKHFE